MIPDWDACKAQRLAKEVNPDKGMISSLIESSKNRTATARMLPLNDITKETVVSLNYDALRELLEALALQRGWKIYNHECYTHILKSIIKEEEFASDFDSLRLLRNAINYYGRKVSLEDATFAITTTNELIKKTKAILTQSSPSIDNH